MGESERIDKGGSLVERAAGRVRDHIRENGLRIGDTLPGERTFAEQLGVSRAVMREAFSTLAALRQIDVGNGRKARVAAIDGSVLSAALDHALATAQMTIGDVWEVRRTIEQRSAELAAIRRSEADARTIVAHADAMAAAGDDLDQLTFHDIALHQTIARASGNALFYTMLRSFEALMSAAVPTAWRVRTTPDQRAMAVGQHRALAQAIADKDSAAAMAEMNMHFDTSTGAPFAHRPTTI